MGSPTKLGTDVMYQEHFGLQRPLFEGGIAREEAIFLGPRQQLVIANLKIALTTRDSIATLAGPVGVGKTTLASQALRMSATRLALAWLGSAPLSAAEVLELLLAEFEFTPYGMGRVERLKTWRQFMTELSATDTRLCILVENAQAIGAEALQALGPLTAADPNGCPGANIVVMGQPGLYEFFENPALSQLKQRIRSRQRIDPLTVAEVEAYLRCRATAAGGEFDKLFAPGAAPALHCFTAGIPRMIDNVCDTALSLAAARRMQQLTPADLMRVAQRMYGLAPNGPIPAVPETPAAQSPAPAIPAKAPARAPVQARPTQPASPAPESPTQSQTEEPPTLTDVVAAPQDDPPEAEGATEGVGREPAASAAEETPVAELGARDSDADGRSDSAVAEAVGAEPESADGDSEPALALADAADDEPVPASVPDDPGADAEAAAVKAADALAEAKSLEDISSSIAEAVFADEELAALAAALEAAVPGASSGKKKSGLSAEETSAVLQLSEDAIPESTEAPEAEADSTPPAREAAS